MLFFKFFVTILLTIGTIRSFDTKSITVLIPNTEDQNALQNRLEFQLIESFAKTIKHHVNYVIANETMSASIVTEKTLKEFLKFHLFFAQSLVESEIILSVNVEIIKATLVFF